MPEPGTTVQGRYCIEKRLGAGGMATVYLARDEQEDRLVSLKVVSRGAGTLGDAAFLKTEFSTLRSLHHPHVEEVFDFGTLDEEEGFFFTCEYIEGQDLFKATEGMAFDPILDLLVQILDALQAVHRAGLVHFDIKPENILVSQGEDGTPRVKLIDFGLVGEQRIRLGTLIRGTLDYLAPEVVWGDPVDHRADLYSLGVTLFRILSRRFPFARGSNVQAITERLSREPEVLLSPLGDVPPLLARMTTRLLEKAPENRYADAGEVVEEIIRATGGRYDSLAHLQVGGRLRPPRFVGHEVELERLSAYLEPADTDVLPALVLVTGEAGMGKSRLMREFRARCQTAGYFFVAATIAEGESRAYGPVTDMLHKLMPILPAEEEGRLAAVLDRLHAQEQGDGDSAPLFDAFGEAVLGAAEALPCALFFDDLHRSDRGTREALAFLLRRATLAAARQGSRPRLLVFAGTRISDEALDMIRPWVASIKEEGPIVDIRVLELSEGETGALAQSMLGVSDLPEGLLPKLHRASRGVPLVVEESVKLLVDGGSLTWTGTGWQYQGGRLDGAVLSGDLDGLWSARLSTMDDVERAVLDALAVFGQPGGLDELAGLLVSEPRHRLARALRSLSHRGLVDEKGRTGAWTWTIRSGLFARWVAGQMEANARQTLHVRAAALLEVRGGTDAASLEQRARHYLAGEVSSRACETALLAARALRNLYQYDKAVELCEKALAMSTSGSWRLRVEVLTEISTNLMRSGRIPEAVKRLEEAQRETEGSGEFAREDLFLSLHRMARALRELGHFREASDLLDRCEALNRDEPSAVSSALLDLERGIMLIDSSTDRTTGRQLVEGALPALVQAGDPISQAAAKTAIAAADEAEGDAEAAESRLDEAAKVLEEAGMPWALASVHRQRGRLLVRRGAPGRATHHFEEAIRLSRAVGDRRAEAEALELLCTIFMGKGRLQQAQRPLERRRELCRVLGDKLGEHRTLLWIGALAKARGEFGESETIQKQALAYFVSHGLTNYKAATRASLGFLYVATGNLGAAAPLLRRAMARFRETADMSNLSMAYRGVTEHMIERGKLRTALAYCDRYSRPTEVVSPEDRAALRESYAGFLLHCLGQRETGLQRMGKGLAHLEATDHRGDGLLAMLRLGIARIQVCDLAGAEELLRAVAGRARDKGDLHREMRVLSHLGGVLASQGRFAEGLADLHRGLSLVQGMDTALEDARLRLALMVLLDWLGQGGDARALGREALAKARRTGARELACQALVQVARQAVARGNATRARELSDEAQAMASRIGSVRVRLQVQLASAEVRLVQKLADEALSLLDDLPDLAWAPDLDVQARLLRSRGLFAMGMEAEGGAVLEVSLALAEKAGLLPLAWDNAVLLAAWHTRQGNSGEAGRLEERAASFASSMAEDLAGPYAEGLKRTFDRRAAQWQQLVSGDVVKAGSRPSTVGDSRSAPRGQDTSDRKTRSTLQAVVEVCKLFNARQELGDLLDTVVDAAVTTFGAQRGFLLLQEGGQIQAQVSRNFQREDEPALEYSRTLAHHVMDTAEGVVVGDIDSHPRFGLPASVHDLALRSVLCVPLRAADAVLGALYLDHPEVTDAFGQGDLALLGTLADLASIAIEDGRLLRRVQDQEQELRRLNLDLHGQMQTQRMELSEVREELLASRKELTLRYAYRSLIAQSPAMEQVFEVLDRITDSNLPVVVDGETGTGKELVARCIHYNGPRKDGPFVSVNCAALPETLLESELFGHVKGAFTGADQDRQGLFLAADGGSLFLDEVAETSPTLQAKLLRVVQEGEVRPVGGKAVRTVDVRLICATNRDLEAMVGKGTFRQDLFYRLNVLRVTLPPLRDRTEDVPLLAAHFLREALESEGRDRDDLSLKEAAVEVLRQHHWPGNVRELKNLMERVAVFRRSGPIEGTDVLAQLVSQGGPRHSGITAPGDDGPSDPVLTFGTSDFKDARNAFEKDFIVSLLRAAGGNVSKATKLGGLDRKYFYKLMKKHEIDPKPFKGKK